MKHAVLIIEDDQWVASYMSDVIKTFFDLAVFVATTRAAATEIWSLNRSYIIAIISDLTLSNGASGENLVRDLTANAPDIPVIFVTGTIRGVAEISESFGRPVSLLLKPFGPMELQTVLKPIFQNTFTSIAA
jgi:DNA-binding NtrC family response regulator